MDTAFQSLKDATWYKLEKDCTVKLIPVFTDYNVSTVVGAVFYDQDIVPSKLSCELAPQSSGDARAWYIDFDYDNMESLQAVGIAIPTNVETVNSLSQLRASFNRKQPH